MDNLSDMLWVEFRKAMRSRMPLWTTLVSLLMPLGISFLIFVARNPEISRELGLVGAKANLVAYATTDWPAYLGLNRLVIAAGGFILSTFIISWVFGREFVDGTLKDMLAVPVHRLSIILAKFIVSAAWSVCVILVILGLGLILGLIIKLPGCTAEVILHGNIRAINTACLVVIVALPIALFASIGRGYILPIGMGVLILMLTNLVAIAGWGDYFPWAVPGLYAQGENTLPTVSYLIAVLTGAAGVAATHFWWKYADQDR